MPLACVIVLCGQTFGCLCQTRGGTLAIFMYIGNIHIVRVKVGHYCTRIHAHSSLSTQKDI